MAETTGASLTVSASTPAKPLVEAFSLTLTVDDYPFIRSHVIDGKAVLPMAMIVEWLAHGALHGNPGFRFHGFNDLRICKGVTFEQTSPCCLRVLAGRAEKRDSLYYVPVELTSSGHDGRGILHARAEMVKAAPVPSKWIKQPLRNIWLTDPLVIDCAFQLMILWSFERFGSGSLPSFAGRYRQFQGSFPRNGAQIVIRVTAEREHSASADMEFLDRNTGKLIARLEGYECVIDPSLERAFRRNQLSQPGCVIQEAA